MQTVLSNEAAKPVQAAREKMATETIISSYRL
jgi:hypothetical protein